MSKTRTASRLRRSERRAAMFFIAPIFIQFAVFFVYFMFYSLYMSLTDWNIIRGTQNFIGFENFKYILSDHLFWKSMGNTLFLMIGIPIGMVFAMLLALGLNRKLMGKTVYRVILYLPAVTSTVAIALLWREIFSSYGVINLTIYNYTGSEGVKWLTDPTMVKVTLIILGVWRGMGGTMLLFLAGLQNVPKEYYEVVDVNGGNAWHKLRHVTLPLMTPTYFYVIITGVIGGLQAFGDQYIIMKGAGPENSALTVVYYLYQKGFEQHHMGQACAVAWILSLFIMAVTLIQFKTSKTWVFDAND